MLKYKPKVEICGTQKPFVTKRNILSQVAKIYDPIGFAAPYLARAKIGLQELRKKGLEWDDEKPITSSQTFLSHPLTPR